MRKQRYTFKTVIVLIFILGIYHIFILFGGLWNQKPSDDFDKDMRDFKDPATSQDYNSSVLHFASIMEADDYMKRIVDFRMSPSIIIHYENFTRRMPKFISDTEQKIFLKCPLNQGNFVANNPNQLFGKIEMIKDGTFTQPLDCGFKSDSSWLKINRKPTSEHTHYDMLLPLIIPHGYLFQHFMDGTFPKLAQVYEFAKRPGVKILLEKSQHGSIREILHKLNITDDKIIEQPIGDKQTVYKAGTMLFSCVAPPLHPQLWIQMRRLLGVRERLTIPPSEATVVLLTRAGAQKPGRNIVNEKQVIDYLHQKYNEKFLLFKGNYKLDQVMNIFADAKIILGVHGGAFYNMHFASKDAVIIEISPYTDAFPCIPSLPHAIFWACADMIGQQYWRVMSKAANNMFDVHVDIKQLGKVLDKVERNFKNEV